MEGRVFNLTAKKAIELYGDNFSVYASGNHPYCSERTEVWTLTKHQHLISDQLKRIILCSLFLKAKLFPDGSFDKHKSRLVAGGLRQDVSVYDNISSPTAP